MWLWSAASFSGRSVRTWSPPPSSIRPGSMMTRDGRHFDRGAGIDDDGRFDTEEDVFGITGALALFRRGVLEASRVDGEVFDADFFAYREDADLAWRLQGFGYRARYVPRAVAYHRRSVTPERRRSLSPAVNYHSVKNRFLLPSPSRRHGLAPSFRGAITSCGTRSSLAPVSPWNGRACRRSAWLRRNRREAHPTTARHPRATRRAE